jgi:aspartate/tyrosine/aromatic aminotransferase
LSGAPVRLYTGVRALRIVAGLLRMLRPAARVHLPAGHGDERALLACAGFPLDASPYLPEPALPRSFSTVLAALCRLPERSVVVLCADGHPLQAARTPAQWDALADACKSMQLMPILEMSGRELRRAAGESDAVRSMARGGVPFMLMHLGAGRVAISLRDAAG